VTASRAATPPQHRNLFLAAIAVLTLACASAFILIGNHAPILEFQPPIFAVALIFALAVVAELHPFRIQFGDGVHQFNAHEVAQVVGIFILTPRTLLITQFLATAIGCLFFRRQAFLKAIFNSLLSPAALSALLFIAIRFSLKGITIQSWLGLLIGVIVSQLISGLSVVVMLRRLGTDWNSLEVARSTITITITSLCVATLTWTLIVIAHMAPEALLPSAILMLCSVPFFGRALRIVRRANSYERLLRFSKAIVGSDKQSESLDNVLEMMRSHLGGNELRVVVHAHHDDDHVTLIRRTRWKYEESIVPLEQAGYLWEICDRTETGVITDVTPETSGPAELWLADATTAQIIKTTNVESTAMWGLVSPEVKAEEDTSDEAINLKFPAMAEQVFTWMNLQRHIQESEYLATHDALTGLSNRELFRQQLQLSIDNSIDHGTSCGVLLIDLDSFKLVNDAWGHAMGDRFLVHVARQISLAVPEGSPMGRLSGDEFVVALPHCTPEALIEIGRRVSVAVARPFATGAGATIEIDSSLGMALAPEDASDASRLLHLADSAMYSLKGGGTTDRVTRYNEQRDSRTERRAEVKQAIEHALATDAIRVMYQPLLSLTNGRQLVKFEALARMAPNGNELSPAEFVPVAETTGLIHQLTARVLDITCRQLKEWSEYDVAIAVNLSVHNLVDLGFVEHIRSLIGAHEIDSSRLVFEVTESMLMRDPAVAISTLNQLRALGISISIDDFGTGHSSMQYLSTLPVDEVKIDRSFVNRATRDLAIAEVRRDQSVLEGLIDLCKRLDLVATVEGLETEQAVEMVSCFGAELGQGYILSRPITGFQANYMVMNEGLRLASGQSTYFARRRSQRNGQPVLPVLDQQTDVNVQLATHGA
jgi:diguanylate cyclase (GGDEF)-like protein